MLGRKRFSVSAGPCTSSWRIRRNLIRSIIIRDSLIVGIVGKKIIMVVCLMLHHWVLRSCWMNSKLCVGPAVIKTYLTMTLQP